MIIWPASACVNKRIARWRPLLILILRVPYIFSDVDRYRYSWIDRRFRVPTPTKTVSWCLLAATAIMKDALKFRSLSLSILVLPCWLINEVGVELLELHFLPISRSLLIMLPVVWYRWRFLVRLCWHIVVPCAILILLEAVTFPIIDIWNHFNIGRVSMLLFVLILVIRCIRIYDCELTTLFKLLHCPCRQQICDS